MPCCASFSYLLSLHAVRTPEALSGIRCGLDREAKSRSWLCPAADAGTLTNPSVFAFTVIYHQKDKEKPREYAQRVQTALDDCHAIGIVIGRNEDGGVRNPKPHRWKYLFRGMASLGGRLSGTKRAEENQ